ncbi:hypothetical protein DW089_01635 [Acidaminococcus sp. AM05-11]|nr:hypothetical protein DW089_01635 [Acidaminococcus sp. AM05-11]
MVSMLIFPSSYFDPKKVDEELREEYLAALGTGLFRATLFGYDAWFEEGRLILSTAPAELTRAVYRGWMMKPEQYEKFYNLLLKENIQLITSPEQYKLLHTFPNVYPYVEADTAKMLIYPLHAEIPVAELQKQFSRFMVKDYVKSVKGTKFPKYFDAAVTQQEFDYWMGEFYKYRGDLLTGGICIKEYLPLKRYENHTNEYRVFYINHIPASISRNSGQGTATPRPPQKLIDHYRRLGSNYYTVDYAELEDGNWKILETGDGGVSGLPDSVDYETYYKTLYECLNGCST